MAKMLLSQHVRRAGITQLVEYQLPKLKVAGSSPVARSIPLGRMSGALRKAGFRIAALLLIAGSAGVWSCASAPPSPTSDLDRAVEDFVDGDYHDAVTKLDAVLATSEDEPVRREAYTYLGRAHMALGETDEAVDAFTRCVQLGDTGPCVEYLRVLQQFVEGKPGALHMNESLTRGQLAGAVVRMFLNQEPNDPTGPTPLKTLEERGWMPVLPDGKPHAEDPVTHASLYVVAARILSEAGHADQAGRVMPGGYRKAANSTQAVSGAEALAVLERVRAITGK
jgi:tetratricopeptide (TPR) repeat protein